MSQIFVWYTLFVCHDSGIISHQDGAVYTILSEITGDNFNVVILLAAAIDNMVILYLIC